MRIDFPIGSNSIDKKAGSLQIQLNLAGEEEILASIEKLNANKLTAHDISTERNLEIMDKCARLWLDREYSKPHIEILAKITNQSEELVRYEIEGTMQMLLKDNMSLTIKEELGDLNLLDSWVDTSYGHVHRQPRGTLFHNISGNAFVVIPISISMGLISKNCNFIKVSGDEPYFAYAFYKSLCEIDESIRDRLVICYFDSSNSQIYETIVKNSDSVIHWGGEYSGKVMSELCAKYGTHLIMHGAKISFEVIDKDVELDDVGDKIAGDITLWEQKACLSPRIVFVNRKLEVEKLANNIAKSLEKLSVIFPKMYMNEWNSIKAIQDRQYCLLKYSENKEEKVISSQNADYTVVLTDRMPEKRDIDRCFYRFIFVCCYENTDEVVQYVKNNIKDYLQTMGYNGDDISFMEKMTLLGVNIITRPGDMSRHFPGTSHDGFHNLQEMTYVVSEQLRLINY